MTQVDPFVHPIPRPLQQDPAVRNYFEYMNRFLHDLWVRTGGGDDAITNISVREAYPWDYSDTESASSAVIQGLYSALMPEVRQFSAVTATSDYTALAYDFVNAKNRIEVKFPQYPGENDVVIIRNGDGTRIKLSGNGKNINGQSSGEINLEGTSLTFQYFIDTDEWFAR